jgi:hypothetical protein
LLERGIYPGVETSLTLGEVDVIDADDVMEEFGGGLFYGISLSDSRLPMLSPICSILGAT